MRAVLWLGLWAVVALVGCSRNNEAWTLRDVRARASQDLGCSREQTVVVETGRNSYDVIGCGRSQTYVCRGGACSSDGVQRALSPDDVLLGTNGEVGSMVRFVSKALRRAIDKCGELERDGLILVKVDPARGSLRLMPEGAQVKSGTGHCFVRASAGKITDLRSTRRYWFYFDTQATHQSVALQPPAAPVQAGAPTPAVQAPTAPVDPVFEQAVRAALDAQSGDLTACSGAPRLVVEVVGAPGAAPTLGLTGTLAGTPEEACARAAADLSSLPQPTSAQRIVHLLRVPNP